jgi:peptide-methionine (S)-S-oxide reductase
MEKATFGAGCFWHVESFFRQVPGVSDVVSGYAGGHLSNPTYEDVCSDQTAHAEVVEVAFDPTKVSYGQLVDASRSDHREPPGTGRRDAISLGDLHPLARAGTHRAGEEGGTG